MSTYLLDLAGVRVVQEGGTELVSSATLNFGDGVTATYNSATKTVDVTASASAASAGGGHGFRFTYSTATTDADPGAGTFRGNNAALASVAVLYVDLAEYSGTDVTAWLDALDDHQGATKGVVRLRSLSDPTKWIEYTLTGWTTATGYRKLTVVYRCGPGGLLTTAGDTFLSVDSFQTWAAPFTDPGTAYTYALADADREFGHTAATAVTATIPPNSTVAYRLGTILRPHQYGAGQVTLAAGAGVTLRTAATLKTRALYSAIEARKIGTNEWLVTGDLEL